MNICALILAGGAGTRIGGCDKGLLKWQGQPFIDYVVNRITPKVSYIAISANRHLEEYTKRSSHVFADARHWQGLGPMAALATATSVVQFSQADWILIVPCDTLFYLMI